MWTYTTGLMSVNDQHKTEKTLMWTQPDINRIRRVILFNFSLKTTTLFGGCRKSDCHADLCSVERREQKKETRQRSQIQTPGVKMVQTQRERMLCNSKNT